MNDLLSIARLNEERAYTIGTAAYVWGFPMMELYRVRDRWLAQGGKVNTFQHVRMLFTAEVARKVGVVRANTATLYSLSWLDLSIEPVVVDLPAIHDRYFTINYIDFYQENRNISNNTVGRKGGSFAFVGPDWHGVLPAGLQRVDVATNTVWVIGRTEVKGPGDVEAVHALQDQYQLTTLGEWVEGNRNTTGNQSYADWPPYDVSDPVNWFALLNEGLRRNPPCGTEQVMLGLFEPLGIGPDMAFDRQRLDPDVATGLARAVAIGPQLLTHDFNTRLGVEINRWQVTPDLGSWETPVSKQTDFLMRAAIAKEAQPGQKNTESIYPFLTLDSDGATLNGRNRYVLRFAAGALPPVDAFWSITLYDAEGFMIADVMRNQIGTYDSLQTDPDGGVTITIQHEHPGTARESNWLPTPQGDFTLTMRLYNPRTPALTLDWVPPAVNREL